MRLLCIDRLSATEAYRRAYGYTGRNADALGSRTYQRPAIQEEIRVLEAAADFHDVMSMVERRNLLARIAKHPKGWTVIPSYSDRVRAIAEDAVLAGERRVDGSQQSLSSEVSITVILDALRAGSRGMDPVAAVGGSGGSTSTSASAPAVLMPTCESGAVIEIEEEHSSNGHNGHHSINPLGPILGNGHGTGMLESWSEEEEEQ